MLSSDIVLLPIVCMLLFLFGKCICNLYFHPLRDYPGPLLARATRIYYLWWDTRGLSHWRVKEWHDKYGEIVRIAPDELSYTDGTSAWPEIYGFPSKDGAGNFEKDPKWWNKNVGGVDNILTADDVGHRRMRRLQNPAFSDKALKAQEPVIKGYVDLLIHQLQHLAFDSETKVVDMNRWYHFTTFDLIGDLAFGEPFHCLRDGKWHWWLTALFEIFQAGTYIRAARRFPTIIYYLILLLVIPKRLLKTRQDQYDFCVERVNKRLENQTDRPDFMSYILKAEGEKGLTVEEMYTAAQVMIVAGSETTATGLTSATYFMLQNPKTFQNLCAEIRGTFKGEDEISIQSTAGLPYLNAIIEETLRLSPPGPGTFPRRVPMPGKMVCGRFVPGGYTVGVHQLSTGRSASNFKDPEAFVPERWLGNSRFECDKRSGMQPFSFGPRNCIGKNLSYAEMRTILSRVVWNFDMKLHPDSAAWLDRQRMFTTWQKTEMKVELSVRLK